MSHTADKATWDKAARCNKGCFCISIFSLSAAPGEVFCQCTVASGHKHYLVSTECGYCIRRFLGDPLLCLGDWLDCL